MNLSLVLSLTPNASSTPALANTGENTPEMAAFQDFLAVVGLPPMAVNGLDGAEGEALPHDGLSEGEALMPEMTGNFLPPALPVLPPVLPDAAAGCDLGGDQGGDAANGLPSGAPVLIAPTALPISGEGPARQPAAASTTTPAMSLAPGQMPAVPDSAATAASADATSQPRRAGLQVDLVALPQATAPQAQLPAVQPLPQQVPQPVLAQLLQAQTRSGDGRRDGRASGDDASLRAPVAAAVIEADMATEAETPRPVAGPATALPAQGSAAQPPVAQPVMAVADMATPAQAASASPSDEAAAPRHDFTAVVERLAEARELARPGRAEMHMTHREFGQVSVRFDLAGDALKVAMSSPDAAFAPAVQAALADAGRADTAPQRADAASTAASGQIGPQADGQRGDAQQRSSAARQSTDQVQRQREGEEGAKRHSSTGSDGSRFA